MESLLAPVGLLPAPAAHLSIIAPPYALGSRWPGAAPYHSGCGRVAPSLCAAFFPLSMSSSGVATIGAGGRGQAGWGVRGREDDVKEARGAYGDSHAVGIYAYRGGRDVDPNTEPV